MGKKNKSAAEQAAKIAEQESEVSADGILGAEEDGTAFTVPADDVTAVGDDGSETKLTDLEPALKGESVTVEKKAIAQKLYTADEVAEIARQAAANAVAEAMKNMPQTVPQIVQYGADAQKVHFLWMAEVADDNTVQFGDGGMYGSIVGKTGSFYVPKSDLSRILTSMNRKFLDDRWLIVVSGLDDEEREALGVNYREGELLDRKAFAKMVELGDELLELYPTLCEGHKRMVAQRYADAFAAGSSYVTRERAVRLNEMSRREGHERGDFIHIIEEMNERDAR